MLSNIQSTLENLKARGFITHHAQNAQEAKEIALSLIQEGQSIGIGGSMTIKTLELDTALAQSGHKVYWHWTARPEENQQTLANAHAADVYLCSANALTQDGRIYNIDGNGNRIAALLCGPKKQVVICGMNKIVQGGLPAALARIKSVACPQNARRLHLDTPCAKTDHCDEVNCKNTMCKGHVILEHPTGGREVHVIMVEENLGF